MAAGGLRYRRVFFGKMVKLRLLSLKKAGGRVMESVLGSGNGDGCSLFPHARTRRAEWRGFVWRRVPAMEESSAPSLGRIQRALYRVFHCREVLTW